MHGTAVLALMVLLSTASGSQPSNDHDAVRIRRVASPDGVTLVIENQRAHDVTVTLTIHVKNALVTRILPETATYHPHSQTEAAKVSADDSGQPWRWRCHFHWTKGSIHAHHDDQTHYSLPFVKGTAHRVSQGYNGRLTHHGQDLYAVDFVMREGATVCAARAGVVVDLKESSQVGGRDEKYKDDSNYVSIAHADGTIGEYHHLQHDGVLVEIGDRVIAGQAIALSGSTGYSTFPHLHFGVYSAVDGEHPQSHRVTFITREGIVTEPLAGKTYTAE